MVARGIRWVVRLIARLVGRLVPDRAVAAAVVLVVCVLLLLVVTGALSRGALAAANSVFGGVDRGTAPGISEPASPLRSGSPARSCRGDTLGRQGRSFVAGGPTVAQISRFTGTAGDGADPGIRGPELGAVDRGGVRARRQGAGPRPAPSTGRSLWSPPPREPAGSTRR